MHRRHFFVKSSAAALAATMLGGVGNAESQTAQSLRYPATPAVSTGGPINVLREMQALRIPTGPYTGVTRSRPTG